MRFLMTTTLILLSACGGFRGEEPAPPAEVTFGAPAPSSYDVEWMGRGSGREVPNANDLEAEVHGRYSVAPERALIRATITVEAADRASVTQRAREVGSAVTGAISAGRRCEARVMDLSPPRRVDEQTLREEATLRVDVVLTGLDSVADRHEAIETCLARFADVDVVAANIVVSDPLLTLDDPRAHRDAVLEEALAGTRALALSDEPVTAKPCRSRGQVTIVERSLAGIALGVDLECG